MITLDLRNPCDFTRRSNLSITNYILDTSDYWARHYLHKPESCRLAAQEIRITKRAGLAELRRREEKRHYPSDSFLGLLDREDIHWAEAEDKPILQKKRADAETAKRTALYAEFQRLEILARQRHLASNEQTTAVLDVAWIDA